MDFLVSSDWQVQLLEANMNPGSLALAHWQDAFVTNRLASMIELVLKLNANSSSPCALRNRLSPGDSFGGYELLERSDRPNTALDIEFGKCQF